jgi:hypothetical protein
LFNWAILLGDRKAGDCLEICLLHKQLFFAFSFYLNNVDRQCHSMKPWMISGIAVLPWKPLYLNYCFSNDQECMQSDFINRKTKFLSSAPIIVFQEQFLQTGSFEEATCRPTFRYHVTVGKPWAISNSFNVHNS